MSIQRKLETARYILLRVAENPDCAKITGYGKTAIEIFVEGIDAVLKRYKNEAMRTRKYPKRLDVEWPKMLEAEWAEDDSKIGKPSPAKEPQRS